MEQGSLILPPELLTSTLDMAGVFGRCAPVEVDIGCGKGRFLAARAKACSDRDFLGIERLPARVRKVEAKLLGAGVVNVRLVGLEASYVVGRMLGAGTVSVFHVYFPDPWPKRRHHQRRLFSREFVDDLAVRLVDGGQVRVLTDHAEYFREIKGLLGGCRGLVDDGAPTDLCDEERTNFEVLFRGMNLAIHGCAFRKSGGA